MKTFVKLLPVLLLTGLLSCKKDKKNDPAPDPAPSSQTTTGSLKINFEDMVDTMKLDFVTKYINAIGDTFKISTFNYYISNIVITKTDNSVFAEPNSYHLVRHSNPGSNIVTLGNVPVGSYKSLSFMIGVDSVRNSSGAQPGDLDPVIAGSMYWGWNSGYVFMMLEGSAPKSGSPYKIIEYHLGGGKGAYHAQRSMNLNFGTVTANVSTDATPLVYLAVDASELFKSPNTINFATDYSQVGSGPNTKKYADNYADMIHFEHVHN